MLVYDLSTKLYNLPKYFELDQIDFVIKTSGKTGLKSILNSDHNFHLIIADLFDRNFTGCDLAKVVHLFAPHLPFIIICKDAIHFQNDIPDNIFLIYEPYEITEICHLVHEKLDEYRTFL